MLIMRATATQVVSNVAINTINELKTRSPMSTGDNRFPRAAAWSQNRWKRQTARAALPAFAWAGGDRR
jgi:hypothetical protein